jgi:hypothetical protein
MTTLIKHKPYCTILKSINHDLLLQLFQDEEYNETIYKEFQQYIGEIGTVDCVYTDAALRVDWVEITFVNGYIVSAEINDIEQTELPLTNTYRFDKPVIPEKKYRTLTEDEKTFATEILKILVTESASKCGDEYVNIPTNDLVMKAVRISMKRTAIFNSELSY